MSAESTAILLRAMGLTTAARLQSDLTKRAESENWGYTRFLNRLLEEESNERLRRRIERLRKHSGLPATKTLGAIDESRLPEKVRRQLPTLPYLFQQRVQVTRAGGVQADQASRLGRRFRRGAPQHHGSRYARGEDLAGQGQPAENRKRPTKRVKHREIRGRVLSG